MNLKLNRSGENEFIPVINRAIIALDAHMTVLSFDGSGKFFCKAPSTTGASSLKDLLPAHLYEKVHDYITQAMLIQGKVISKYHVISASGERSAVRFVICPHKDPISTTSVILEAIAIDDNTIIQGKTLSESTLLKEKQSKRPDKEPDWETIFHNSPGALMLVDPQGNLIKCNKVALNTFGYTAKELLNKNISDLCASKEVFPEHKIVQQLLNEQIPSFQSEMLFRDKNGIIVCTTVTVAFLREGVGNAPAFILQFQENKALTGQEALADSKAKYDTLLSATNDALFFLAHGKFTDCNDHALKMFACEREDIIGMTPFTFSPDMQPGGQPSVALLKEKIGLTLQGCPQFFLWQFRKSNGRTFEAEVSLNSISLASGPVVQIIVRDITQRKEGERAIRESESRFKAIFEGAGIGIAMTDPYGKLIESNEALEDFLGYSKEELLDKAIIDLVHPDDRDFENRYLFFYQGVYKRPGFFEKRYIRKDGSIIWGKLTTTVIHDEEGIPAYGIGMLEDITQRKLAEQKARENQELLNKINENLTEGIYRSIPGKGLVYANKAFAKMFGYESVAEALRLSSDSLNNFYDEKDKRKSLLNEIKKKGSLKNKESLFRRKDGTNFWGLENSTVSTTPEGVMIIDGVVVDITERKKSEELLKNKNEELKKINEELDRFVYSASHDLRAPLTSLLGLINIAQTDRYINGIAEHLELMRKSVSKLDSFIIDIINYSRNARLNLEVEEIDLNGLVYETLENLGYISSADKIEKRVKITQKVPLYSDGKRLSVLLNNLISNAIRYHNLIIDAPFIEIKGKVTKKEVRLEIIDNGKGIGKQYINNIFEMFFRASDDSKGSGLGLYIVKETVAKLNGKISVTSEIGKGSTFLIVFPNLPPSRKKEDPFVLNP